MHIIFSRFTMKCNLIFALAFCCFSFNLIGQESLLVNAYNRDHQTLDGDWKYIIDPYENGYYNYRYKPFDQQEHPWASAFFLNSSPKDSSDLIEYNFDKMESLKVPGDWNSQKAELLYYEGTVWYKKSFDFKKTMSSNKVFVYFEASNYKSEVYLNGKKLGTHVGGFTPFNFEVSELLKEKDNFLIVKVDNKRLKNGVPTLNTDWWNYGGLTRGVKLIETPDFYIEDYFVQLDQNNDELIKGFVQLKGDFKNFRKILLSIPELKIKKTLEADETGLIEFEIKTKNIDHWSLEDPKLYELILETDREVLRDQIGFRSIKTKGAQILLNDKAIYLKGISIHEESPTRGGRGHSLEDAETLLAWAKDLGCNYVRLAHYAHNEHMVRLADKLGLLVWEENPVYWTISWDDPETYANAENQLTELIDRDKNRASVIIWSMANETPNVPSRNIFLKKLAEHARKMDGTRLISAALEQKNYNANPLVRTIDDPFADVVDVLSFNQYIGWYDGLADKCKTITWKIQQDKPVLISEFGAGAKKGMYGSKNTRWTEEYQENLYIETLNMIDKLDKVVGFSPWVLVDFKSPRRVLPEIQDGWNRKGLIDEKGERKKAFYVLKEFYKNK